MVLLTVKDAVKSYRKEGLFARERLQVLKGVSFELGEQEVLGIIGESGSGKSTLGRLVLGIEKPDRGIVELEGRNVAGRGARTGKISAVFQDYTSSLHPFYTVEEALAEPLRPAARDGADTDEVIRTLLTQVGLNDAYRSKFPHQLSGGEAQRVCIARAVSTRPKFILLDEAVSSLDNSVQFQVLELLKSLRLLYGTGYIFITHDIQAAVYLCDRLLIMREGRIEEAVQTAQLKEVRSPYAKQLLAMTLT